MPNEHPDPLLSPQNQLSSAVLQFCFKIYTSRLHGRLEEMSAFPCVPPVWYILMIRNWQLEPTSIGVKKESRAKDKTSLLHSLIGIDLQEHLNES